MDIVGYDTRKVPEDAPNVFTIAGWSDRVLEMIPMLERGSDVVSEIKRYASWERHT
ncbi:MAG TPA: hypothetical protein PK659_10065 [Methanothrix sp.]|nr:hypothetical protein [Methanothrix sp.]HOK59180.1 hypothetical protein [Methanothrix sp.]HOL44586.1 hypothetical protein [Methanothrix sp.]HPO89408.1 hypothetical protein [Methanothrix sp.]